MEFTLSEIEVRVLGVLIEKEITTPDYYPLSLNAVTNACNQKSNRSPVMSLEEKDVVRALDSLKDKRLVWQLNTAGGRVPKYEHNIRSIFSFSSQETAVLNVLMLRGPQTPGEIRTRAERLHTFKSIDEVIDVVKGLMSREDGPYVVELPRQPGRKENRYMHLFTEFDIEEYSQETMVDAEPARKEVAVETNRINTLEERVANLENELQSIKETFEAFRKQFE